MPTNTESLNRELFRLLSKYKPKPLDAEGKATPVPDEADIFKFEFTKDGEDYGTVYVTLDDERVLTVYFGDDVSDSPGDKTPGLDYDDTWSGLLHQLSSWRMTKGLRGFKTQNKDRVGDDMARRNHMRNKDKIAEGYYPMGKSRSYSDAVPSVKIVIEHSRVIEEGEQRYRNINRIFLENQDGERYLLDTKKPGIARVYARHIAEGGKVNDDRWSHIGNLCEEYQKMAGFVRATRNGQFNESAQALVNEGLEHYVSLRESLSRMTGKRGYNAYFESWTPPLMEDGTEENNLNELFVQETLDPRIESVMPILNRIHKKVSESIVDKEMNKLAEWADQLVEGPAVDANAKSPTGSQSPALAHYADQLDHDASVQEDESIKSNNPVGIPEGLDQYSPVTQAITRRILSQHPDLLQKHGPEKVGDAIDSVAEFVGDVEEIGSSDVSGWVKQVAQSLGGHEGMEETINTGASLQRFKNDPRGNQKLPAKEVDEGSSENKYSNLSNRGVTRGINRAADDFDRFMDLDQAESPHYKTQHQQDTKKRIQTKPMAGPKGVLPEQGVAEGSQLDEGAMETITALVKKIPGIGKYYQMAQQYKPQLVQILKTSKSGKEVKQKMEQLAAGQSAPVAESGMMKQLGGLALGGGSILSTLWMNAMGMIDGVLAHAAAGEVGGAVASGSILGLIPVTLMLFAAMLLFKGSKQSSDEKAQAFQAQRGQQGVAEDLDANQKRVGQLGPTGGPAKPGDLVGANENFINMDAQAVTSEGEHTQHAMRGRNPGANEFEHDFEPEDKVGNIHDKISKMLKKLSKPEYEPSMKDTDLGSTVVETTEPWETDEEAAEREKKEPKSKDTKGSDGSEHGGHSRAKHLAKNAIPKDDKEEVTESEERPYVCVHAKKGKCEVKANSSYQAAQKAAQKWGLKGTAGIDAHLADVEKDTSSLDESTDELARILTIMNHRR
jgi:hypothetical protein